MEKKLKNVIVTTIDNRPYRGTKEDINVAVIQGILDTDDPVNAVIILRNMQKGIEAALKDDKVIETIDEVIKTGNTLVQDGFSVHIGKTAVKYDYSKCGHAEYDAVLSAIATLNARKKALEEELRLLHRQATSPNVQNRVMSKTIIVENLPKVIEEPSGEVCEVKPPTVTSKRAIVVK